MFAGCVVESRSNGWTLPILKDGMLTASHRDTVVVRAQRAEGFDKRSPKCPKAVLENATPAEQEESERRVLRILVQQELKPIAKMTHADELARVFMGIVDCHHWLYETAKILHRDISLSTLMFQGIGDEGYGVLSDFNLANFYGRSKSLSSKKRTGTRAYMAIDLLVPDPPEHLYRHDLESLSYGSRFADWDSLGTDDLGDCKFLATYCGGYPPQKKHFARFDLWIILLHELFHDGRHKRHVYEKETQLVVIRGASPPAPFDDGTLGGTVTFDAFSAILVPENFGADGREDKDKVQTPK
ncbi:hypothetical protein C8R47DRAFT_1236165 [Mycena vitilis]|nr:hypothetical protein C8R47DRAFT_1236165 [Mycena vitilis]